MIAALEPAAGSEKFQPKDRIEELQETVSASRLGLWGSCRLKFYFRYCLKIKKPPTPAMHAGSSVHGTLQQWNRGRWRREPFVVERFKTIFEGQWKSLQALSPIKWDKGEEDAERSSSWRALKHYFSETPIKADEKPEGVEVAVSADLSKHGLPTLIGIIDLVRSGGRIVDFKVVGKTPDSKFLPHLHEIQLTAYSVLYRDATGRNEGGLELHHLVRTKQPKVTVTALPPTTDQQQARLFWAMESYQAGVARQDFVPSPGFLCAGCEFLRECKSWKP